MRARIIIVIITVGIIFNFASCTKEETITLTDIDYNRSISDGAKYFGSVEQIEDVFLKSIKKGSNNSWLPGPASYNTIGFLIVSEEVKNTYLGSYDFVETEPIFPEGIDPATTEFIAFNWCECYEFTKLILEQKFVGEVCFDTINGIIFVNVENT